MQTNLTAAMSLIEPVIFIVMGIGVVSILIALYLLPAGRRRRRRAAGQ